MPVSDLRQFTLPTPAGTVDVTIQNGRTLYVRAGLEDSGRVLEAARGPLDAGRAQVSVRAHFRLADTPHWLVPTIHRVDQQRGKEPTAKMVARVLDAVGAQLVTWAKTPDGRRMLEQARRDTSEKDAVERTALAFELRQVADHLDEEARELRAGGTRRNRRRQISSGFSDTVTRIQRADGTLMDVCPEPPHIYGASSYKHVISEEDTD